VPLQDCHAYRNAVGRFDHRPRRTESVCPMTAAPAIFGAPRLWGARALPARELPAKSTRVRRSTEPIEPDRFIELAGAYLCHRFDPGTAPLSSDEIRLARKPARRWIVEYRLAP